jgi:hypothetical protein
MAFWNSYSLTPKIKSKFIVKVLYFDPKERKLKTHVIKTVKTISKPSVEVATKEFKLINHYFNYPGLAKWSPITITFVDMAGVNPKMQEQFLTSQGTGLEAGALTDTGQWLYNLLTESGYRNPNETGVVDKPDSSGIAKAIPRGKDSIYGGTESPIKHIIIQQIDSGEQDIFSSKGIGKDNWDQAGKNLELYQGKKNPNGPTASPKALKTVVTEEWKIFNPIIKSIKWGDLDYSSDDLVEYTLDLVYDYAVLNDPAGEYGKTPSVSTAAPATAPAAADDSP